MKKPKLKKKQLSEVTDQELRKIGFKRKWMEDKSGHWWELNLTQRKGVPVKIVYDRHGPLFVMQIRTVDSCKPYSLEGWSDILRKNATVHNLIKMIHYGTLIASTK